MKAKVLIRSLQNFDPNTEVKIVAQNGLILSPEIKLMLKDKYDLFNHSKENLECIILTV